MNCLHIISEPFKTIENDDAKPLLNRNATHFTLSITLINPFSDANGPIESFELILIRSNSLREASKLLRGEPLTWAQMQVLSSTEQYLYQPFPPCTTFQGFSEGCEMARSRRAVKKDVRIKRSPEVVDVEIGTALCEGVDVTEFCNGPLLASSIYFVTFRASTVPGYYKYASMSDLIRTSML